jgi:D-glycero-D-manno-heptose 1,7-bisphosphate phosphatase
LRCPALHSRIIFYPGLQPAKNANFDLGWKKFRSFGNQALRLLRQSVKKLVSNSACDSPIKDYKIQVWFLEDYYDRRAFGINMIKLIALDRDGIINEDSPAYVKSLTEFHLIPESLQAIAKLKQYGYKVVVASNQSGIGRGLFSLETLNLIHRHMLDEIKKSGGNIDEIFICPHKPEDNCECRKPKPGLLLEAANRFKIEPTEILMIGDSMRDILAAKNCGANAMFIKTNSLKDKDLKAAQKDGIPIYSSLAEAVAHIYS